MDVQAWLDQQHTWIAETIRRVGWSIQFIGGSECSRPGCCPEPSEEPFAYTIGLFGLGHPELLVVGVGPAQASLLLNTLGAGVRRNQILMPGQPVAIPGWESVIVPQEVEDPEDWVLWANDFYRQPPGYSVPALRLDTGFG